MSYHVELKIEIKLWKCFNKSLRLCEEVATLQGAVEPTLRTTELVKYQVLQKNDKTILLLYQRILTFYFWTHKLYKSVMKAMDLPFNRTRLYREYKCYFFSDPHRIRETHLLSPGSHQRLPEAHPQTPWIYPFTQEFRTLTPESCPLTLWVMSVDPWVLSVDPWVMSVDPWALSVDT